jgi:hypothetical protein
MRSDLSFELRGMSEMTGRLNEEFRATARLVPPLLYFTAVALVLLGFAVRGRAADFPQARISNRQITAKVYLPDPVKGYYRSTRFDWSGALYSLEYQGHNFYGTWFNRVDPKVINWVWDGNDIVSGPCSGLYGPVDEFQTPLGWDESKPGGTFIKIGVGVLRRGEGNYNRFVPYDVLDSGKWTVKRHKDSIQFQQELSDPASGYAYVYRKTVRLEKDKPNLVIEHSLKNLGKKTIQSSVYNHNFVVLDKQAPGPDFTFRVPFQIITQRPPDKNIVEVRGNEVVYLRPLAGKDEVPVFIQGFGNGANDSEIVIENRKVGAGLRISGDRPLARELLWSIRSVLAIEPYVSIDVAPGAEFTWKNTIEYYTLPAAK